MNYKLPIIEKYLQKHFPSILKVEFSKTQSYLGSSFDFTSTGSENEYVLNVPAGQLQSDTYYLRVSYSAEYPEDHEYTVTINLSEGGAGGGHAAGSAVD